MTAAQRQALTRLLVFSAVAGLVLAGVLLPLVGGAGLFARNATVSFNNLPADLKAPPPPERSRLLAADGSTLADVLHRGPGQRAAVARSRRSCSRRSSRSRTPASTSTARVDLQGTLRAAAAPTSASGQTPGRLHAHPAVRQERRSLARRRAQGAPPRTPTRASCARRATPSPWSSKLTKERILERYLNIAYFGDGAYGVEAAARHYFGVTPPS